MAFFDKLGKKLEGMVQDAHEYTSDLIEVNRLNGNIRSEREAIDALQKKVGVAMHKRFQAGETVPDDIRPELEEITDRLEKIVGLESKVEEARRTARSEQAVAADRASEADAAGPVIAREWPDEDIGDRPERAPSVPLHAEGPMAGDRSDADLADRLEGRTPRADDTIEIDVPLASEDERKAMEPGFSTGMDEPVMGREPSGTDPSREDLVPAGSGTPTEADIVNEQSERPLQAAAADPDAEPARPSRRFCTNCGAPLVPGKPFCGNCGQRND